MRTNKFYEDRLQEQEETKPKLERDYVQEYEGFPHQIIKFKKEIGLHPTQKPVELMEYLIRQKRINDCKKKAFF